MTTRDRQLEAIAVQIINRWESEYQDYAEYEAWLGRVLGEPFDIIIGSSTPNTNMRYEGVTLGSAERETVRQIIADLEGGHHD